MAPKRSNTQATQDDHRKRRSRDKPSSEEEDSEEEPCTQFLKQKEDVIKDCLVFLLAHNSTLMPIKKSDIFNKFGEKVGRKERNAILRTLKAKLHTIGAFLKPLDGNRFILVNQLPKNILIDDEITPERQFLCLILTLIAINKGSLKKDELENSLNKLGIIYSQCADPYFGDISKLLTLFEKQCYLKKYFLDTQKKIIAYEWNIRAHCEVEKDGIINCITSLVPNRVDQVSQINLSMITPPEDEAGSDLEEDD